MKITLALILGVSLLAGCGSRDKAVRIAVAVPLTGDMGTEGQGVRRAVTLAVEEANAAKRFPFKLEVLPFDDRADPKEAVTVANLIASDLSIVAVIGHYTSGCTIPAAKVYARIPLPVITPDNTNPEVTRQQLSPDWSGPRVVFRLIPTDEVQGAYAATYLYRTLGRRRVSLLNDKSPYGQGLVEQFQKTFTALGGRIVSSDGISVGDKDFKALLTRIQTLNTQCIYFAGLHTEAGLIVTQMRALSMDSILFMSGDGTKTESFFDVAGAAADGAYVTMSGMPPEVLKNAGRFVDNYKKRWSKPGEEMKPYDHYAYDAAQIIFDALDQSGPDHLKLIQALHATRHVGVTGTTTFDEIGDTLNKVITMTRAQAKDRTFPVVD